MLKYVAKVTKTYKDEIDVNEILEGEDITLEEQNSYSKEEQEEILWDYVEDIVTSDDYDYSIDVQIQ